MSSEFLHSLNSYFNSIIEINNGTSLLIFKVKENSNSTSTAGNVTNTIIRKILASARNGSAHRHAGISWQRFLYGLLVSLVYFVFQLILFSVLRIKLKSLYQANRILSPKRFRGCWLSHIWDQNIDQYKDKLGLDAYLFMRFLRFLIFFFFTISMLNLPILLPIHFFSQTKSQSLDKFNMSNISSKNLIIHLVLCVFVICWFHLMLVSELRFIADLSNDITKAARYQNVLFLEKVDRHKTVLAEKFKLIGEANDVTFIPREYKRFYSQWSKMRQLEEKLEKIVFEIISQKFYDYGFTMPLHILSTNHVFEIWKAYKNMIGFYINKYIFFLKTITNRVTFSFIVKWVRVYGINIPFIKISSSSYLKNRYLSLEKTVNKYQIIVKRLNERKNILTLQSKKDYQSPKYFYNKAFISFDSSITAHIYGQFYLGKNNGRLKSSLVGPNPRDIMWSNLTVTAPMLLILRSIMAGTISIFIIVGWVIPVAIIGAISQIPYLVTKFLVPSILESNSEILSDMIASVFPVITLVFLTECAPYFFRLLSYLRGCRTGAEIEKDTQNWFFVFLFVQLFLVVTVSSGISFVIERIVNNPTYIPTLLAHELPKSSNFFCSFILIRGFAYSGGNLIRVKELLLELFYYKPFIYTPHKRFKRLSNSLTFQWGSIYPLFSVFGCIGIVYSLISPLILPLCCISFILVYFSFKYLFEYQFNKENKSETFGKLYPQSLLQLYAGVYFMEFCLLGLFALSNRYELSSCMIIISGFTIIAHFKISRIYMRRIKYVPLCPDLPKTNYSGKHVEKTNQLSEFVFPKADFNKNYKRIWLPYDNKGIADAERRYLERNFGLICDLDVYSIDTTGSVYLQE
ncbi:hypothetical protein KAFR_0C06410 [Kazachstania africana CBS 2517]|uniref:CSC1/OSCA1-like 7TM region domain-containing protein n=1 Tax=Kazachstania africana (strain ATCC 22294 / BCRC 22015 / CBS 2517 / CECT 1963 / NBRC 1671 / NRRL Y-8276) TaxID=1071382 RepID=H2ATD7_KAZAF|nr:hypothetical protein KAFR_0C06410 [Kazachstania africana CBS 2517]CCF57637.1 hypothetical protein KAFR_0C06410 [Kazachstania africana CBS 2517]